MKRILTTTYAVNPYKGSEDGMGWNFIMQIARFNKVISITRENNRQTIEKYMEENPNTLYSNIEFLYFDLPYWTRFWKKGSRGAMLYYLMWQHGIVSFIKKQKIHFDIVHNVNFHNDWTPSFLWKLDKPFVWGPVGHHPLIPSQYLAPYSKKYWIKDRLTWMVKQYFWKFSNNLNQCKKRASHILCMNHSVPEVLGLNNKYSVTPSVATQDFGWMEQQPNDQFTIISAGRFVPLKGFDLTIEAFSKLIKSLQHEDKKKCHLILVGSGPEEHMLKKICIKNNIVHQVKFISWIERDVLMEKFKTSSVFLFPSHEGAGMVVAEALSFGVPVVCLDNEGPGEFIDESCGIKVKNSNYKTTTDDLSDALKTIYYDNIKRNKMRIGARKRFENVFHWDRRGEQLQKIYAEL
jgi:glycosyltransferase involved in cell wall biosynthesis